MADIDDIHSFLDSQEEIVIVKQPQKHKKSRVWVYLGAFCVSFVIGFTLFFPVFNNKTGYQNLIDMMSSQDNTLESVADTPPEPYIYTPPNGTGTFGKWSVNVSYYRNWLNNTVVWKVEKSTDGIKWVDYKKFIVKKDWDEYNLSEKHTIIVDSDEDAYYRIIINTEFNEELVSYDDKSIPKDINDTTKDEYELKFKVSDDKHYELIYNWSDYNKSDIASETNMIKDIKTDSISNKQYFEWMIVSNVKIKSGEQFILDPAIGTIPAAVTDSWEYDAQEARMGNPYGLLKIGDTDYYVGSARGDTGTDQDGFLRTFHINPDNGVITESLTDSWEYDNSDGYWAGIWHISGNVYAVVYRDIASSAGTIFTTTINNDGTYDEDTIDSISLAYEPHYYPTMVHVTGDVYAVVYHEVGGGVDMQIETFEITSAGAITDSALDIQEFDSDPLSNYNGGCHGTMVDTDTLAVVYQTTGYDCFLKTYDIDSGGDISNSAVDSWEFYTGGTTSADIAYPRIINMGNNIFAILYSDTAQDGWVGTISISDAGSFGTSFIDSLEWSGSNTIASINTFIVVDTVDATGGYGVLGITAQIVGYDGGLYTVGINSDGSVNNSRIDYLEFDTVDNAFASSCVHVNSSYYLILYQHTGNDGKICTVEIETPEEYEEEEPSFTNVCPVASGEHPTNSTTGIDLQSAVGCFITDGNSNHTMNVTFATNTSGSFVNYQTNSSVANNSAVNWTFTQANTELTKYYWRVYVHDGICNQSFTFHYTTAENVTTWQNVDTDFNGEFTNTTAWHDVDTDFDGGFTNTTVWKTIQDDFNGEFTNVTVWVDLDTDFNGEFTNTTTWKTIQDDFNGEFMNTTAWHDVDTDFNGGFTNTTVWKTIQDDFNGEFTNVTVWADLDTDFNGVFTNASMWHDVDTDFNGEFTNTTAWHDVDTDFNGEFTNTTAWHDVDTDFNGEFTNASTWKTIQDDFNGEFTNTTTWHDVDTDFNGEFTNTTAWHDVDTDFNGEFTNVTTWADLQDTFNGVFTNTTPWNDVDTDFNGEFTNTSGIPIITITNIYPTNNSNNVPVQPIIYATFNHSTGNTMNVSWYYGTTLGDENTLFGTDTNINNGTQNELFYPSTNLSTIYYWKIVVNDGNGNWCNESYSFTTEGYTAFMFPSDNSVYGIIGILGLLGFISFIIISKRRKNNEKR